MLCAVSPFVGRHEAWCAVHLQSSFPMVSRHALVPVRLCAVWFVDSHGLEIFSVSSK